MSERPHSDSDSERIRDHLAMLAEGYGQGQKTYALYSLAADEASTQAPWYEGEVVDVDEDRRTALLAEVVAVDYPDTGIADAPELTHIGLVLLEVPNIEDLTTGNSRTYPLP